MPRSRFFFLTRFPKLRPHKAVPRASYRANAKRWVSRLHNSRTRSIPKRRVSQHPIELRRIPFVSFWTWGRAVGFMAAELQLRCLPHWLDKRCSANVIRNCRVGLRKRQAGFLHFEEWKMFRTSSWSFYNSERKRERERARSDCEVRR